MRAPTSDYRRKRSYAQFRETHGEDDNVKAEKAPASGSRSVR